MKMRYTLQIENNFEIKTEIGNLFLDYKNSNFNKNKFE